MWLNQGDRNITYFHAVASGQKRRNWIATLEQEDRLYTNHADKASLLFNYFFALMGSTQNTTPMQFQFSHLYSNPLSTKEW
jgi:hypothetical protein